MNEMNFIPSSIAQQQRNQRLLQKAGRYIVFSVAALLATLFALSAYNQQVKREIAALNSKKNQINELLASRKSEESSLKQSQRVAASLNDLNSFSALTAMLDMLNDSIPDETELTNFETEIDQTGRSIVTIVGVADTHQNLTQWIGKLQETSGVQSAELVSSESIQSTKQDELKQKFLLQITRLALEEGQR